MTVRPKCIVLPIVPGQNRPDNRTGLALHFLLGNVVALHTGFAECWFGWRVGAIFDQPAALTAFCGGSAALPDLAPLAAAQKVPCWVHGHLAKNRVQIRFFDADTGHRQAAAELPIDTDHHLTGFRSAFIDLLDKAGHPMPATGHRLALWPEITSLEGLDLMGQALETFYAYSAYDADKPLDLTPFQTALAAAPDAFMARNLMGWAHYRRDEHQLAARYFSKALDRNPAGVGAMAGLIWCATAAGDRQAAVDWQVRKAQVRNEDQDAARQKALARFEQLS